MGVRYHYECFKCVRCDENFIETGNKNITQELGRYSHCSYGRVVDLRLYCAICAIAKQDDPEPDFAANSNELICGSCKAPIEGHFTTIGDEDIGALHLCSRCLDACVYLNAITQVLIHLEPLNVASAASRLDAIRCSIHLSVIFIPDASYVLVAEWLPMEIFMANFFALHVINSRWPIIAMFVTNPYLILMILFSLYAQNSIPLVLSAVCVEQA